MKIGNQNFKHNIFLAPLAGITDMAFRILCKKQGCELLYTEMISAKGIYYNDDKSIKLGNFSDFEEPIGVQIFGSDPLILAHAAHKFSETNCTLIDINMGCPVQKVTKNKEGSALMNNPTLVGNIVKEVVNASSKPITIKIRKGWDDNNINAVEIAKIAEQNGAAAIGIHGRTREQFYSGKADWDIIKKVKQSISIPVIGNGDVFDPISAKAMFEYTKCDGIMVARGALGNPWIFKNIIHYFEDNILTTSISNRELKNVILEHFELLAQYKGEFTAIREMRKHVAWYIKGLKNCTKIKQQLFSLTTKESIIDLLNSYFQELDMLEL